MTPIGADAVTAITNRFVAPEVVDGVYTLPFGHKELHEFSF